MSKLFKKIFLLTESRSIVSQSTAKLAAKEGAIVICADKNPNVLSSLKKEIEQLGAQCMTVELDVTSLDSWKKVTELIVQKFGKIDILVNTIGISSPKMLLHLSSTEQDELYETTIGTILYGLEMILPIMKDNRYGSIVNVSTLDGLTHLDQYHVYAKTNEMVQTILTSKATEYLESNIRINSICPVTVNTPLLETNFPQINMHYKQSVPFPHLGKIDNIVDGIIYLASDETSFISGAKLVVTNNIMPI